MEELEIEIADIRYAEERLQEVLNNIKDIKECDEIYEILDGILNNDLVNVRLEKENEYEELEEEFEEYADDYKERDREFRIMSGF